MICSGMDKRSGFALYLGAWRGVGSCTLSFGLMGGCDVSAGSAAVFVSFAVRYLRIRRRPGAPPGARRLIFKDFAVRLAQCSAAKQKVLGGKIDWRFTCQ